MFRKRFYRGQAVLIADYHGDLIEGVIVRAGWLSSTVHTASQWQMACPYGRVTKYLNRRLYSPEHITAVLDG